MNKTRKPNAMLIELVIVILFFSISAGIILQLFVAAHDRSKQSTVDTCAVLMAEDLAECIAASTLPMDVFLAEDGWTRAGERHTKTAAASNERPLALTLDGLTEESAAGTLDVLTLSIADGERTVVTMPINRYLPKEATP